MLIPFKNQALAETLAQEALIEYRPWFATMDRNMKIAIADNDIIVALSARIGVDSYLSAAYLLESTEEMETAGTAFLAWGCELAKHFKPAPELLLTELCVAIDKVDHSARRQLAEAILDPSEYAEPYNLYRAQAYVLAAILVQDYHAVERYTQRLQEAAMKSEFGKADSYRAGLWIDAVRHLVRHDLASCATALDVAYKEFRHQVDIQLGRLKAGKESDLTAYDLVDWPTVAVRRLLRATSYHFQA